MRRLKYVLTSPGIIRAVSKALLTGLLCVLVIGALGAQSSSGDLKEKRKRLLQELQETTERLESTRKKKSAAVEQLSLLRRQIRKRRELIATLQQEITLTNTSLVRTDDAIGALTGDIDRLKDEYSRMLRTAYRARLTNSWLTFLLSADSFNDAFRRWRYLQQYQRYRQKQALLIMETQTMLRTKRNQLEQRRLEKAELLAATRQQDGKLQREVADQNQLVTTLTSSEGELLRKIERQKKAHEEMNQAIERSITAEMASRRRADRAAVTNAETRAANAESDANSRAFAGRQGRLPWPATGDITKRFGRQPHPEVPSVEINNSGIDIAAGRDAEVKAVHEGEVILIKFVPGYKHTVLVKHGNFFTVYSNLEVVEVQRGDAIRAGQYVGRTGTDGGPLHFEVWREKEKLNPERWLGR